MAEGFLKSYVKDLMRSSEKHRRGKRFVKDVGDQKAEAAGGRIA